MIHSWMDSVGEGCLNTTPWFLVNSTFALVFLSSLLPLEVGHPKMAASHTLASPRRRQRRPGDILRLFVLFVKVKNSTQRNIYCKHAF